MNAILLSITFFNKQGRCNDDNNNETPCLRVCLLASKIQLADLFLATHARVKASPRCFCVYSYVDFKLTILSQTHDVL